MIRELRLLGRELVECLMFTLLTNLPIYTHTVNTIMITMAVMSIILIGASVVGIISITDKKIIML